jgi:hypothetical protein
MTPAARALRAKIAAHEKWARNPDRKAATAPARRGFDARFERQVDPDGELARTNPRELAARVKSAKSAYFARLSLRSAMARAGRSGKTPAA